MKLDFICQVIDNYGDIAVVWRLVKALLQEDTALSIRVFVDDLKAFQKLVPDVKICDKQVLTVAIHGKQVSVEVIGSLALSQSGVFCENPAQVLVEAFGAPTPEPYLEAFRKEAVKTPKLIIHLEYLTAEPWAQEYHLLPSLVPWPGVKKVFFVPSFLPDTGGVIVDQDFWAKVNLSGRFASKERREFRRQVTKRLNLDVGADDFLITLFSYEHDYGNFWDDLGRWISDTRKTAVVVVFEGRQKEGADLSWSRFKEREGGRQRAVLENLKVLNCPFLAQNDYDDLLLAGDFHVVRGEESWVRAVLSGRPFLWHAYLQPDGYQLVKTEAFMTAISSFFKENTGLFEGMNKEFLAFNQRQINSSDDEPQEHYSFFFQNMAEMEKILKNFAVEVVENRNLAYILLDFLHKPQL